MYKDDFHLKSLGDANFKMHVFFNGNQEFFVY